MSHTEIYMRQPGQALKEGKLEIVGGVMDRYDAEADARTRCAEDASIWKIGYYTANDDGQLTSIYSYENPASAAAAPAPAPKPKSSGMPSGRRRPTPPKKKSLLSQVMGVFSN